jgi:putative addiction module component (TIGR02574 family)
MPETVKRILDEALTLTATERAAPVDELLASLDRLEPRIDAPWAREAEERLAAFEAGEMEAIPADEVFADFEKPGKFDS